jgi:Fic family protein
MDYLPSQFLNDYSRSAKVNWVIISRKLATQKPLSAIDFKRLIAVASVTSSQIEGSSIDVNSYFRKRDLKKKDHEMQDIENLIKAYQFASSHPINQRNILKIHVVLAKGFIEKIHLGKLRKKPVFVVNNRSGQIIYAAADQNNLASEIRGLLHDIQKLEPCKLSTKQAFYYASLIHLRFVKIHPFVDGNGRVGRLLEKWFLSTHIGKNAWSIPSEVHYWENKEKYYHNLALLGPDYETSDWGKCIKFLLMLPESLKLMGKNV